MFLLEEAQKCRREAEELKGNSEAIFLLRVARAFEELAELNARVPQAPKDGGQSAATGAAADPTLR